MEFFENNAEILDRMPIILRNSTKIRPNKEVIQVEHDSQVNYFTPEDVLLSSYKDQRRTQLVLEQIEWFKQEIANIDQQFQQIFTFYSENKDNLRNNNGSTIQNVNIFDGEIEKTYQDLPTDIKYKNAVYQTTKKGIMKFGYIKKHEKKHTQGLEIKLEEGNSHYHKPNNPYIDYQRGGIEDLSFVFECFEKFWQENISGHQVSES